MRPHALHPWRNPRKERDQILPSGNLAYSPAFAYAPVGKESTHFPCGSEAVMINSALALEAFRSLEEVNNEVLVPGSGVR